MMFSKKSNAAKYALTQLQEAEANQNKNKNKMLLLSPLGLICCVPCCVLFCMMTENGHWQKFRRNITQANKDALMNTLENLAKSKKNPKQNKQNTIKHLKDFVDSYNENESYYRRDDEGYRRHIIPTHFFKTKVEYLITYFSKTVTYSLKPEKNKITPYSETEPLVPNEQDLENSVYYSKNN